jgi:hypothetical protein
MVGKAKHEAREHAQQQAGKYIRNWKEKHLAGRSWRVRSLEQLLAEKEGYAAGIGRPLRPKDTASITLIRQLLARQGAP